MQILLGFRGFLSVFINLSSISFHEISKLLFFFVSSVLCVLCHPSSFNQRNEGK